MALADVRASGEETLFHRTRAPLPGELRLDFERLPIPSDSALQSFLERGAGPEAEIFLSALRIQTAPWLAVGLRAVPTDFPIEAGQSRDKEGQILDRYLLSAADVDWIGAIVSLRRERDRLGTILDIEKLSGGRAVAPARKE